MINIIANYTKLRPAACKLSILRILRVGYETTLTAVANSIRDSFIIRANFSGVPVPLKILDITKIVKSGNFWTKKFL